MKASRTRWVCIGRARGGWYVLMGNCGFPGGVLMSWQGRVGTFQPMEFLTWGDLWAAIRMRLAMARLEAVAIASGREAVDGYRRLWVEVVRKRHQIAIER
nr:hypothetical protein [uncultured Rhodopila sp.]